MNENKIQSVFRVKLLPINYSKRFETNPMQQMLTAKFSSANNESFINRFKTELTQNNDRSEIHPHPHQNQSDMNISDLQLPLRDDYIIVNGVHQVGPSSQTIYRCPICDRLRAICPYKNYKTYEFCQKCVTHDQKKRERPKIFDYAPPQNSKQLSATFDETRGLIHSKLKERENSFQAVDKVRFTQTNRVYPLTPAKQKVTPPHPSTFHTFKGERTRMNSSYVPQVDLSRHKVVGPVIQQSPNIEEVIFYPVIHNKVVYKSGTKPENDREQGSQVQRSRYKSEQERRRTRKEVERTISEFMQGKKADEILTPVQFKKLADSIYRQSNPNMEE